MAAELNGQQVATRTRLDALADSICCSACVRVAASGDCAATRTLVTSMLEHSWDLVGPAQPRASSALGLREGTRREAQRFGLVDCVRQVLAPLLPARRVSPAAQSRSKSTARPTRPDTPDRRRRRRPGERGATRAHNLPESKVFWPGRVLWSRRLGSWWSLRTHWPCRCMPVRAAVPPVAAHTRHAETRVANSSDNSRALADAACPALALL